MSDDVGDLRALVLADDGTPETRLEELVEDRDIDDVWEEMRSVHRELDRRWEMGDLPADRLVELRSRLSRLALQLSRLSADKEVRAYRQFLRDVSHDIRSPLHSIIFLTEALHSSRQDERPEAEQRQLSTIYAAGTSLLNLVNDLLDYARIQQGEIEESSTFAFSVTAVLSDVRQLLGPLLEHRDTDLTVKCEEGERFVGDPHVLNRVLTNLLSNAVEATGRGGHVAVRVAQSDGGLLGQVFDDGEDADIDNLRSLLEMPAEDAPMTRVRRELDGSCHGLGLLICSRLVHRVGGWIRVESADGLGGSDRQDVPGGGRGTRFTFWLPFRAESGS